jgi:hypothetical protein
MTTDLTIDDLHIAVTDATGHLASLHRTSTREQFDDAVDRVIQCVALACALACKGEGAHVQHCVLRPGEGGT